MRISILFCFATSLSDSIVLFSIPPSHPIAIHADPPPHTRYLVYNLRKRDGDSADKYFRATELIAGVKDMRFQALMPDVLHWMGIRKIDNMVSMSDMYVFFLSSMFFFPCAVVGEGEEREERENVMKGEESDVLMCVSCAMCYTGNTTRLWVVAFRF